MVSLTIWRFDSADGAFRAARTLKGLSESELIHVHDAAIVSWEDGDDKPRIRQLHNLAGRGALAGAFWGMLFGLIFLMPLFGAAVGAATGAVSGSLKDIGIDDDMIKQIRDQLMPGTSALFVLSSEAVIEKVRAAFEGQETPELIFTNLTPEQDTALRTVFARETASDAPPAAQERTS